MGEVSRLNGSDSGSIESKKSQLPDDIRELVQECRQNEREQDFKALRTRATRLGQLLVKQANSSERTETMACAFRWVGQSTLELADNDAVREESIQMAENCLTEVRKLNLSSVFPHESYLEYLLLEEVSEFQEAEELRKSAARLEQFDSDFDTAIQAHREREHEDLAILLRIRGAVQQDLAYCAEEHSEEEIRHLELADQFQLESAELIAMLTVENRYSGQEKSRTASLAIALIIGVASAIVYHLQGVGARFRSFEGLPRLSP